MAPPGTVVEVGEVADEVVCPEATAWFGSIGAFYAGFSQTTDAEVAGLLAGSSRRSPRNLTVTRRLNDAGLTTLLFDLLTQREAADRANVFDIELLAARLVAASRWLQHEPQAAGPALGYFGASTGAAAALWAAAELGSPATSRPPPPRVDHGRDRSRAPRR